MKRGISKRELSLMILLKSQPIAYVNEEEGFLESKASSEERSVKGGLQVKFWQTRATTLLTA